MNVMYRDNSRFERDIVLDCYQHVPNKAEVQLCADYQFGDREGKYYILNGNYRTEDMDKFACKVPGIFIAHNDREGLPNYAAGAQSLFETRGIKTSRKGNLIALDCSQLRNDAFLLDDIADVLHVPMHSLVGAYLHLKGCEPSGRQLFRLPTAVTLARHLSKSYDDIIDLFSKRYETSRKAV